MMTPVGVYREENGCGSCHDYAMNSDAMADYDGVGWRSVAGDPWFLRSTGGIDEYEEYDETEQFEDDEDIEELADSLDEDEA